MTAVKKDLYIEQGATFILDFQWCARGADDPDGNPTAGDPRNLTGMIGRMQIRKSQQEVEQIDATTVNGKIVFGVDPATPLMTPDLTNGWIHIELPDEDTDEITLKTAKYDLEIEDSTGRVYRLLQGGVTVDPNYTQEAEDEVLT